MKLRNEVLKKICERLIKWDPNIVEIVQFGSSVYMPEYSRDLDLLVFTRQRKDYGVYLDATCEVYDELDFPHNIDVVPCDVGRQLNESLAVQVRGACKILYGRGKYLREATDQAVMKLVRKLELNPTFEDACMQEEFGEITDTLHIKYTSTGETIPVKRLKKSLTSGLKKLKNT